jgi:hypothetical protein
MGALTPPRPNSREIALRPVESLGGVSIENHCEASPRSAEISSFTGIEFIFTTALKRSTTGMRAINMEFRCGEDRGDCVFENNFQKYLKYAKVYL